MAVIDQRRQLGGVSDSLQGNLHRGLESGRSSNTSALIPVQRLLIVLLGGWEEGDVSHLGTSSGERAVLPPTRESTRQSHCHTQRTVAESPPARSRRTVSGPVPRPQQRARTPVEVAPHRAA